MSSNKFDIVVVGGGIVGLASAYKLNLRYPEKKILLLEKETAVASHQTGHNSGVIHSGIYYKPGSYKAKNCVEGRQELVQFAREHHIAHDICGKIIVTTKASELPYMHKVYANGVANGITGIEALNADQIKEIEPFCTGIEGLWVPCTGIIDYTDVARKLVELIHMKFPESKVLTGVEVTGFVKHEGFTSVITNQATYEGGMIVSCAGLHADRVAIKDGLDPKMQIVGFRGDYFDLSEQGMRKVKNLIYPVPNPEFPFLGVHFTRMIHGGVECGPNAVFTFKREGYGKTDFNFKDSRQALTYKGTWKLMAKHWRFGLDEYKRAFSKKLFLDRLQQLIPSLTMEDIVPGRAGVRAMALGPDGAMVDDFQLVKSENSIHVLNAPSPAATASLAIGTAVQKMVSEHFNL